MSNEREMYQPIAKWLQHFLRQRFKGAEVWVGDVHARKVSHVLMREGLSHFFPESETYEVKVDVLGVIVHKQKGSLAIVECKIKPVTLMDLAQIVGYSKVLKPAFAIILSPKGWSAAIEKLINTFNRDDILEYGDDRKVVIARWDAKAAAVSYGESLPQGYLAGFIGS